MATSEPKSEPRKSSSSEITVVQLGSEETSIEAKGQFCDKDTKDYVPSLDSKHLRVDIPTFDGPLDLLLHLIKRHSMDIFDIPIGVITQKYLAILDNLRSLDLDIAGEFIVMAATLTQIKSKLLLPPEEGDVEDDDEEIGEDPRAELVRKLLDYQRFKEAASSLKNMDHLGKDVFIRPVEEDDFAKTGEIVEFETKPTIASVEAFELIKLLSKAIKNSKRKTPHEVFFEPISVRARIHELLHLCELKSEFGFRAAIEDLKLKNKVDIVITFLALLEMARLNLVEINNTTDKQFIWITVKRDNLNVSNEDLLADLSDEDLPN